MSFNTGGAVEVPLETFGGLVTETSPDDLPPGVSPDNQDVAYVPGGVFTRPALKRVFATPFPAGGPLGQVPTITYAKSYVTPTGAIKNLYLDANGVLWIEDLTNAPGLYVQLFASTPGTYAKSITAFGREYIAISDGLHGQEIPLQYDGTNLDRVTQDGPGAPPSVANLKLSGAAITSLLRAGETVTAVTTAAHNLKAGYQVQLAGVNSTQIGTSIVSVKVNNEDAPGIATVEMTTAHGLVPGNFVYLYGITGTAVGGGITAISRSGGVVTVTTAAPHSLAPGASVTIAGVATSSFNGTFQVQAVPGAQSFTYLQSDSDATDSTGTVQILFPVPNWTYFQVLAAPSSTSFQVQLNYSDATWSTGHVAVPWNGTYYVASVPSSTSFTYKQAGPPVGASSGTATPFGQAAPGVHQLQVSFLTRQGAITRPSPPVSFIANGGQYLSISNIPIGPSNVVARILEFTGAGGAFFFYIPVAPQVNGQVVGTPTQINDNTSTSVTLDFSDNTLYAALGTSAPGNNLANQLVLDGALGFGYYGGRLLTYGQRNRIQNLLNMSFDGGAASAAPSVSPPSSGATYVQSTQNYSLGLGTVSWPFDNPNAAGNTIIVSVGANADVVINRPTDTQGNVYSLLAAPPAIAGNPGTFAVFIAYGVRAGANTVTATLDNFATAGALIMVIREYHNLPTSFTVLTNSASVISGGSLAVGSCPELDNNLAFATTFTTINSGAQAPAGGYTWGHLGGVGTFGIGVGMYDVALSAGTFNGVFTSSGSPTMLYGVMVVFGTGVLPLGWTSTNSGGALVSAGHVGTAWQISPTSAAQYGNLAQSMYQDAYGAPIAQPNTAYKLRAWLKPSAAVAALSFKVVISSASLSFTSTATISGASMSTSGSWLEATFSSKTPATIPSDLTLTLYASATSGTPTLLVDELSIIYADTPYLDGLMFASYVNNPEGFDGVTGKFGPSTDTRKIMDFGVMRETLYLLTQDPTGRLHETGSNGVTEPAGWQVNEVGANCGALSAFALTKSQADDSSASGGEEWLAWASSSGARIFAGSEPSKISQEVQPDWDAINAAAALTIWVLNDPVARVIYFGLPTGTHTGPNLIYPMNYRELDSGYQIAQSAPVHTSFSGKLVATDNTRKWTRWNVAANGAALMYRAAGALSAVFFNGNGQVAGTAASFGNVYTLSAAKLTDDDYGQIASYYVTYFFVNHEAEIALGLGAHRKMLAYLMAFISGTGNVTITALMNTLTNAWALTCVRLLSTTPTFDLEWTGGSATAQRMAFKIQSSPVSGTDNAFSISKLIAVLKPASRLPVRGSSA